MKRAILLAVLFLLAECNVRHRVSDAGKFIDGVYRNDFFGIVVNVPDDLSVKTREDMESLRSSLEALTGEKIRGEGAGGTGEILLSAQLRRENDADSVWRYSLSMISESLDRLTGIETGEQYAVAFATVRGNTSPVTEHVNIGGREFVHFSEPVRGTVIEDVYARIECDHALVLTVTYDTIIQFAAIDSLFDGIRFEADPLSR